MSPTVKHLHNSIIILNLVSFTHLIMLVLLFLGFPSPDPSRKFDKPNVEKRVSFDSNATNKLPANVLRTQSLTDGRSKERRHFGTRSLHETSEEAHAASEVRLNCILFLL